MNDSWRPRSDLNDTRIVTTWNTRTPQFTSMHLDYQDRCYPTGGPRRKSVLLYLTLLDGSEGDTVLSFHCTVVQCVLCVNVHDRVDIDTIACRHIRCVRYIFRPALVPELCEGMKIEVRETTRPGVHSVLCVGSHHGAWKAWSMEAVHRSHSWR